MLVQKLVLVVHLNFLYRNKMSDNTLKSTIHKYVVNDQEFNSIEEMPPAIRKIFDDQNNNGMPDIFEAVKPKTTISTVGNLALPINNNTKAQLDKILSPQGSTITDSKKQETSIKRLGLFVFFAIILAIGIFFYYRYIENLVGLSK